MPWISSLPMLVLGVGLAGEDDLDGPVGGLDQLGQPLDVLEDQAGPLVGGEPAGEADGQGVQVERLRRLLRRPRRARCGGGPGRPGGCGRSRSAGP